MKWLAGGSAEALGEALRVVAPELTGCSITIPGQPQEDPMWHSSTAFAGEHSIAKFAWSRPAALRLAREIGVLTALAREPAVPFLPEVAASIDRDQAGRQLACFLAALHQPSALERAEAGIPLADHRTPPEWVDDVAARFRALGIDA